MKKTLTLLLLTLFLLPGLAAQEPLPPWLTLDEEILLLPFSHYLSLSASRYENGYSLSFESILFADPSDGRTFLTLSPLLFSSDSLRQGQGFDLSARKPGNRVTFFRDGLSLRGGKRQEVVNSLLLSGTSGPLSGSAVLSHDGVTSPLSPDSHLGNRGDLLLSYLQGDLKANIFFSYRKDSTPLTERSGSDSSLPETWADSSEPDRTKTFLGGSLLWKKESDSGTFQSRLSFSTGKEELSQKTATPSSYDSQTQTWEGSYPFPQSRSFVSLKGLLSWEGRLGELSFTPFLSLAYDKGHRIYGYNPLGIVYDNSIKVLGYGYDFDLNKSDLNPGFSLSTLNEEGPSLSLLLAAHRFSYNGEGFASSLSSTAPELSLKGGYKTETAGLSLGVSITPRPLNLLQLGPLTNKIFPMTILIPSGSGWKESFTEASRPYALGEGNAYTSRSSLSLTGWKSSGGLTLSAAFEFGKEKGFWDRMDLGSDSANGEAGNVLTIGEIGKVKSFSSPENLFTGLHVGALWKDERVALEGGLSWMKSEGNLSNLFDSPLGGGVSRSLVYLDSSLESLFQERQDLTFGNGVKLTLHALFTPEGPWSFEALFVHLPSLRFLSFDTEGGSGWTLLPTKPKGESLDYLAGRVLFDLDGWTLWLGAKNLLDKRPPLDRSLLDGGVLTTFPGISLVLGIQRDF